mmetsp:Transcript_26566/g.76724  ORF Transcript_26566/g.76724 Transcript_26566/m.76724 type:complete len:317 (+) Transcript_26566:155-1105(+)
MRNCSTSLLSLAALFAVHVCSADQRTYKVYHRLGAAAAGGFSERGSIVLSTDASTGDGDGNGTNTASTSASASALTVTATNAADCVIPSAVDDMVASNSMYTIQVVDDATGQAATASVPGCDVRRANFREELELTLSESGSLVSVTYIPLVSPLAPSCASLGPLAEEAEGEGAVPEFQTTVSYETSKPAMTVPLVLPKVKPPPGLSLYPRKKPAAAAAGGEGADGAGAGGNGGGSAAAFEEDEKPQNQSFLMKYWYIILPLMILQFVGGSEQPPPQQEEGGGSEGGNAAGSAAGTAGGAAAANAAAAPRQRRGKRG